MHKYTLQIIITIIVFIGVIIVPSSTFAAFGSRPNSYADLSSGHKTLLKEVADARGYKSYQDAGKINSDLTQAFNTMKAEAAKSGVNLSIVSGYRSYNDQIQTFFSTGSVTNPITKYYGENMTSDERAEVVKQYTARGVASAPPGYSEHSTGLAIDINSVQSSFKDTQAYTWLKANASKYGFELSYPEGSSQGAGFEPWHWRYIGGSVKPADLEGSISNASATAGSSNLGGDSGGSSTAATTNGSVSGRVSYQSFTSFPGLGRISNLCELTQALWYLGFSVLLLSVFGMYVYGGYMYTTAGSNAGKVNQAKEVFINSTIGLVIGLSVFLILNIINPTLLQAECEIEAIGAISGSGPISAPTTSGEVGGGGAPISGSRTCTEIDPSVWKFQGGKSLAGVDQRLHGVATAIFKECGKLGEFQISSTVRTCCGTSFHITGDALDWADGSQVIRDKPTGQCIERVAAECGIPQSRINPGVDAKQRYHVHIDLGTRQ